MQISTRHGDHEPAVRAAVRNHTSWMTAQAEAAGGGPRSHGSLRWVVSADGGSASLPFPTRSPATTPTRCSPTAVLATSGASAAGRAGWTRSGRSRRSSSRVGSNGGGARTGWRSTSARCPGSTTTASGSGPGRSATRGRRTRRGPGRRSCISPTARRGSTTSAWSRACSAAGWAGRSPSPRWTRRGAQEPRWRPSTRRRMGSGCTAPWAPGRSGTGRRSGSTATGSRLRCRRARRRGRGGGARGDAGLRVTRDAGRPAAGQRHGARARRAGGGAP